MQNAWILITHQRGKVVTKDEIKKNLRRAIMKHKEASFFRRLVFGTKISMIMIVFIIFMQLFFLPFSISLWLTLAVWIASSLASTLATYIPEIHIKKNI